MKVAGAQIPVIHDVAANVKTLHRAIEFAAREQADILLTPEGSLSGYRPDFDPVEVESALSEITSAAKDAQLALALGTCFREPSDGLCYNQIRFYDRHGNYQGFHSKTLCCGSLDESPVGDINHYSVAPLEVRKLKGVQIGGLICNDLWANPGCTPMPDPHLTQHLSRKGARIIFHAVNGGRGGNEWSEVNWRYHESNLRMRAQAAKVWIVTVDNCHPDKWPCSSPSGVVAPDGSWAIKTESKGEQLFTYDINTESNHDERATTRTV